MSDTTELAWLDYNGETTAELLALEGKCRTDAIVLAFEQGILSRGGDGDIVRSVSPEERVVLAVEAMEREVNSGGFESLFSGQAAILVPHLVSALQSIGRVDVAALADKAIKTLKIKGPLTAEALADAADIDDEKLMDKLTALDERYYEVAGDLAQPLLNYIKANSSKIMVPR